MIVRPTSRARIRAALLAALLLSPSTSSRAERSGAPGNREPSLLLGGGAAAPAAAAPLDPRLPTGARIRSQPRPSGGASVACGLREMVCVHHDQQLSPALVEQYVSALEEARRQLVALGLPTPLVDPGLGPTSGLDLYLGADAPLDVDVTPDPATGLHDRRSAFCRARPSRAEAQRQALTCVAEAVLLGLDAAEAPFITRAIATHVWHTLGAPNARDLAAVDTIQSNPQLCVAGRDAAPESAGAALLFAYADARLAAGPRGVLPFALAQLSRAHTEPGRARWSNEPDAIDVLRQAFATSSESFEDFMLGFAVERAFLGARDNGRQRPELAWLGDAGNVRFDWVLPASTLPRRVAPRRPLEPFGAAYSWLSLDRITLGKTLAFRAEWESPASFRWTLVAVDASGDVLRRFDLPFVQNATSAERTLLDYDGAVGLLIVGVNLGGIDLAHPFDPDHEPFEPHGFTLYLTEL